METVWFAMVAAMLAVYVVLDGFDFGVGVLHRLVARTDDERRTVLAAIGPVRDGNEVWLVAAAVVLGASLGNMVRGVPLDSTGFFAIPLFTDFRPGVQPGIFDWYTTLVAAFALCGLAGHGALYLVWKTAGPVQVRSAAWARKIWLAVLPLWLLVTLATAWIQPGIFTNLLARPWSFGFVLLMLGGLCGVFRFALWREDRRWGGVVSP